MGTSIYYFTGTGNSLMAARHIAAILGKTRLISIPKVVGDKEILLEDECIGIVFPVYYYGIPRIVKDFMEKISVNGKKYIFCVATCGGSTGIAFEQVSKLLEKKDAVLAAGFKLVLPDNYILMYNPTGEEKQALQFKAEYKKIKKVAETIKNRTYTGVEERSFEPSKLLAPLLYRHTKKFGKDARKFWTNENCNGCGSCKLLCPVNNIEMKENRPVWKDACQQCLACIHWCPKQAIQYGKGTPKRRRYHNPEVTLQDIISSAKQ